MVLMLIVVTRSMGVYAAGVFSLATAAGQQFQTLGAYEVRPYQATDVKRRFGFGTYLSARFLTVAAMFIGIVTYSMFSGGSVSERLTILVVASLRILDAFEDVFYGEFQRVGRLDVGARANFFRVLTTIMSFVVLLYLLHSLAFATLGTMIVSTVAMLLLIVPPARARFSLKPSTEWSQVRSLLAGCLPLAVGAFLAMYLNNAPRYAIERSFDATVQGYYGVLFVPALAINILAMFFFRPMLTRMATMHLQNDGRGFIGLVARGVWSAAGAFLLTAAVAYVIGVQVLELLYGVSLDGYRTELMILILGGGLNALSIVLYYALTTLRKQVLILCGYAISSVVAYISSRFLVSAFALAGAAWAYVIAMGSLTLVFGFLILRESRRILT